MSQIGEIHSQVGATPVQVPRPIPVAGDGLSNLESAVDRVDISEDGQRLADLGAATGIRYEKVESARAAIERGDYNRNEVIDRTVERLIEDL